ncbi:MAG: bifunctional heptose 7-phosphate kinase/heptose 1-phosphate adenyltransferase [Gemmatimonadota bacterium]
MPAHPTPSDPAELRDLVERAGRARVLVIGDAMLDRYVEGTVERISPEAPVPVVQVTRDRTALGGAANVAAGVVALGARCRMVAAVGDDEAGEGLVAGLRDVGIPVDDLVATPGRPTTQKTRILGGRQQMLRVDRESTAPLGPGVSAGLLRAAVAAAEESDVIVFQDYDKGTITPRLARGVLDAAAELDVPTVVDPKLRNFFDYAGAYLFKPNRRELAAALGVEEAGLEELDLGAVRERLDARNLLLTLGSEGMLLAGDDVDGLERIPSRAQEVFDVTGAGDTVLATVAVALAAGASPATAARIATVAAGLEVSHAGAVPITAEELLAEIE